MREPLAIGPFASAGSSPAALPAIGRVRGRGWDAYLFAAIALVPIVVPVGPAQMAFLDVLTLAALFAFVPALAGHRPALRMPFALPAILIATGSLLALTNAAAPRASVLAMAQDLYLYLWFVLTVHLWAGRGGLDAFRLAWVAIADVVALGMLVAAAILGAWSPGQLVSAHGIRWAATFYNPNMCADYLVLSVFVLLSLEGRIPRAAFAGSLALLGVGLLLTKSNGGLCALAAGLAVWASVRALARGARPVRVAGSVALLLGVLVVAAWGHDEWRWGERTLERLNAGTFAGRVAHSSEGRGRIWAQLVETVQRQPMGIGPANSAAQAVAIGERERPGSFRSKEAHSDYIAAWVERGFLGFLGLALAMAECLRRMGDGWRSAGRTGGASRLALAAMIGGLAASAVHSAVIEKLHFRHFWLYLALAIAMTGDRRE